MPRVYAQVQIQFVSSILANKTSLCLHTDQNVVDLSVYCLVLAAQDCSIGFGQKLWGSRGRDR